MKVREWNEWTGGEMPVSKKDFVDLKFRSGYVAKAVKADNYSWDHYESNHGGGGHIVAWRKHLIN